MDMEQQWKNMGTPEDTHGMMDFFIPVGLELKKTTSPLFKIKKALEITMSWIVVTFFVYLVGIILFEPFFTKLSLLLLAGYSTYYFFQSLKLHRQIEPMIITGNSVKAELERHYYGIMQWCKIQERNAIFLYPISLLGGAILGMSTLGVEKMSLALQKPAVWIALACIIIVFVPLLYYVNRRMMKVAYYNHLEHLKGMINSLQE